MLLVLERLLVALLVVHRVVLPVVRQGVHQFHPSLFLQVLQGAGLPRHFVLVFVLLSPILLLLRGP